MLGTHAIARNAFHHSPLRERREVFFSRINANPGDPNGDLNEEQRIMEFIARAHVDPDVRRAEEQEEAIRAIREQQQTTGEAANAAIDPEEAPRIMEFIARAHVDPAVLRQEERNTGETAGAADAAAEEERRRRAELERKEQEKNTLLKLLANWKPDQPLQRNEPDNAPTPATAPTPAVEQAEANTEDVFEWQTAIRSEEEQSAQAAAGDDQERRLRTRAKEQARREIFRSVNTMSDFIRRFREHVTEHLPPALRTRDTREILREHEELLKEPLKQKWRQFELAKKEFQEKERVTHRVLHERSEQLSMLISDIQDILKKKPTKTDQTVAEIIRTHADQESQKKLHEMEESLNQYQAQAGWMHGLTRILYEWREGDLTPEEFINRLASISGSIRKAVENNALFDENERNEILEAFAPSRIQRAKAYIRRKPELQGELWKGLNESDRLVEIEHISDMIGVPTLHGVINAHLEDWRKNADEWNRLTREQFDHLYEVGNPPLETYESQAHGHGHGGLLHSMNIQLYSINDVIAAFKKVTEAYKHAWHERTELKATLLAKAVGTAIPGSTYLAGEVKLNLDKAAESANNKETGEFKEYLEKRNFSFHQLFEGHEEESMAHNKHEPNKARAILEYAASKGWLYDITKGKGSAEKSVLGFSWDDLLSDWTQVQRDNYFIRLIGENTSGEKKEAEAGKSREQTTDQPQKFIDAINRELEAMNFWGAIGVAQRAIERGLAGEISPWIATTVLRKLRDPDGRWRKYVNRAVLDQFGIICLSHSAFTLSYLKTERRLIEPWLERNKETGDNFERAGKLANIIMRIEADIRQRTNKEYKHPHEKLILDRMVARVLAGETVDVCDENFDGVADKAFEQQDIQNPLISIFTERYADWHKPREQASNDPGNEDDDYFRNASDAMLGDVEAVGNILTITGSGQLKNGQKATHFAQTVLKHLEKMEEKGMHDEARFFRRTMGSKLESWLAQWLKDSRSAPAVEEVLPTSQKPMILEFIKAGLIRLTVVQQAMDEGYKLMSRAILNQVVGATDDAMPSLPDREPSFAQIVTEARRILEKDKQGDEEGGKKKK